MLDYYFMNTFPHYCINTCSKLLSNKYMELNETKAIAGVPRPGPIPLYKYFIIAHPLIGNIINRKNYKIYSCMILINL